MSSKRRIRRRACAGKQRHETQTEAVAHIIHLRQSFPAERLRSYKCRFCGGWHVGHHG